MAEKDIKLIEEAKKKLEIPHEKILSVYSFKKKVGLRKQWIVLCQDKLIAEYFPPDSKRRHRLVIPYERITSVSSSKGMLRGTIRISEGAHEYAIEDWAKGEVREIAQAIQNMIREPAPTPIPVAAPVEGKKFCSQCGGPLAPDAKFCSSCGAQL